MFSRAKIREDSNIVKKLKCFSDPFIPPIYFDVRNKTNNFKHSWKTEFFLKALIAKEL